MEATVLERKANRLPFEAHRDVRLASVKNGNVVPEGYMTVEKFRTEAKQSLTKILNEHGIY